MPIISTFFGIIIRMYFDDHDPPHFHAEYQGETAVFGFDGSVIVGQLPRTAKRLVRIGHVNGSKSYSVTGLRRRSSSRSSRSHRSIR